jgi:lysophospholipase L1-like esterase
MLRPAFSLLFFLAMAAISAPSAGAAPKAWAGEIDLLTAADKTNPPPTGAVVFVGSSSIRLWSTLADDFPDVAVINRGFGGSDLADSVFYFDRLISPHQPRLVVLYAGENDINGGKAPEQVLADFQTFRAKLHTALPETKLIYLAIKLSPSRSLLHEQMRAVNRLIAADCETDSRCTFVDTATPLLDADGRTRPEFFVEDQLHLSPAGYAIWKESLAPQLKP